MTERTGAKDTSRTQMRVDLIMAGVVKENFDGQPIGTY